MRGLREATATRTDLGAECAICGEWSTFTAEVEFRQAKEMFPGRSGVPSRADARDVPGRQRSAVELQYLCGNPFSPGNSFGRVELSVSEDGRARLHQVLPGAHSRRSWEGRVDLAVLDRLLQALRVAGFPVVPEHALIAGTTLREVRLHSGGVGQVAIIGWFEGRKFAGYADAFEILDSLVRVMSEDAWRAAPNVLPAGSVSALVRLPDRYDVYSQDVHRAQQCERPMLLSLSRVRRLRQRREKILARGERAKAEKHE